MTELIKCTDELFSSGLVENIAIRYGKNNDILGELYRSKNGDIDCNTMFDMASVTKILATTSLTLIAIDRGLLKCEDKISKFYKCLPQDDQTTVQNLLTHTFGIGHKSVCKEGVDYQNVAEYILSIPKDIPVGSNVLYSCPAFMLLGKILEKVFGMPLDKAFSKYVAAPLDMSDTVFLTPRGQIVNANINNDEKGLVNDYNCRFLGGVAGNAGVFSNICDMTKFVSMLLNKGQPLFSKKTFDCAVKNYTPELSESRGLGFLYVDGRYSQTGKLFPDGSVGHCGHTGQSFFVDLKTGFYTVILSDMTVSTVKKYGREDYGQVILAREKIHNAIKSDIER